MTSGRSRAVLPLLLLFAVLFVLVVHMPRPWRRVARSSTADRQTLVHQLPATSSGRSTLRPTAGATIDRWLQTEASAKLATQPIQEEQPPIPTTDTSSMAASDVSSGPLLEPLDQSAVESLPDVGRNAPAIDPSAEVPQGETKSRAAARPQERVARRSTPSQPPVLDPQDARREISAKPVESQPSKKTNTWCPPESLYAQLRQLSDEPPAAAWAKQAIEEVRRLGEAVDAHHANRTSAVCASLRNCINQAERLADELDEPSLATRLRRAAYAIRRRLDVWRSVLPPEQLAEAPKADPDRLRLVVADVGAMVSVSPNGLAWRDYLLLQALDEASRSDDAAGDAQRKALARDVLGRIARARLTQEQRDFLSKEPMTRLGVELRRAAGGAPESGYLLAALERYEQTGLEGDARRLADECLWLGLEDNARLADLQSHVAMHYRNANLRIVVHENLLNRLMPERLPEYAHVRDTILGNPVHGDSLTATEVKIALVPDPGRVHMALQVTGEVAALTSSTSGPAVFQNTSESRYVARKPMVLGVDGLRLSPAEVEQVNNVTRLRQLQTAFDGVPLLGALVHSVAQNQHEMKRSEVRREVERKVAVRAKERIDNEADARLSSFSKKLDERVLSPMRSLAIGPEMVEAKTTADELLMRLRIASSRQLGAHTPRPIAPAGSLASVQVHQTAIDNMIERLGLEGKTFTLPELRAYLAQQLNWSELRKRTTDHDDVEITFADEDAVRVECQDGQITINLAVARLRQSPRTWRDFQVRVHYRPQVEGLSAELVRDGVVELPETRMRTSSEVALRGIFSKIFSKNRARQIIPERIRNHPKMSDLAVTQMTIEDGWLAVALGPRPQVARIPQPTTVKPAR
jgi:hypothetical protein